MKNPLLNPTFHMKKTAHSETKSRYDSYKISANEDRTFISERLIREKFRTFGNGGNNKEIQTTNFQFFHMKGWIQ
jgi:hypothetical protein